MFRVLFNGLTSQMTETWIYPRLQDTMEAAEHVIQALDKRGWRLHPWWVRNWLHGQSSLVRLELTWILLSRALKFKILYKWKMMLSVVMHCFVTWGGIHKRMNILMIRHSDPYLSWFMDLQLQTRSCIHGVVLSGGVKSGHFCVWLLESIDRVLCMVSLDVVIIWHFLYDYLYFMNNTSMYAVFFLNWNENFVLLYNLCCSLVVLI